MIENETRGHMSDFGRFVVQAMILHKDTVRDAERIGAADFNPAALVAARAALSEQTIALAEMLHSLEPLVRRMGYDFFDPSPPQG